MTAIETGTATPGHRLAESVVLVTGATAGIGRETALALGRLGAHVIVHGRDQQRGPAVVSALESTPGGGSFMPADFATQKGVTGFADRVQAEYDGLDALVNNAGGWFTDGRLTDDGLEYTFAVNHLAPFRLTHELLPLLATRQGRVVTVASDVHRQGTIDFEKTRTISDYNSWQAYCRSKLANILFTRELARRLEISDTTVTANSLHPGIVPGSGFFRNAPLPVRLLTRVAQLLPDTMVSEVVDTPAEAAATPVYLVATQAGNTHTGQYFVDQSPTEPSAEATETRLARRLWTRSAELAGIAPDYGLDPVPADTTDGHVTVHRSNGQTASSDAGKYQQ